LQTAAIFKIEKNVIYQKHLTDIDEIWNADAHWPTTSTLHLFNGPFSRATWVSRHHKSRTILGKPIWIYWSKR